MAEPTAAHREHADQLSKSWRWNTTLEEELGGIAQAIADGYAQGVADERARARGEVRRFFCRQKSEHEPCDCERCYFVGEIEAAIERGETP